jgi:general secretion pathway protein D
MTIKTAKFRAVRLAVAGLCCLALPLLAQVRTGGGFTGGGNTGGANRGGAGGSTGTGTSTIDRPGNGQVGTANFDVDQDSRQLFVIADDATTAYVQQVVSNLNRPKPQVLIKVVFLEVTYNKGVDVGIEGGIKRTINASTTASASNLFGLAAQGAQPTTGITSLQGAGLYSIVGNDFSATLRAIEEKGKIEVLSRPTILARNNQMATITVGQEVPLVNSVTYDTFGNEHLGINYQSVGIILQVTPFITTDNMVEMILAPQISSVNPNQSQAIAFSTNGNVTAPYIDIRSANTVVVTPDGQTVVIGGLMQNSRSSTDSKIPILGDIPGLGLLFHHKVSANTKTELIMLLTPYVVKTPSDLARMSEDERGRAQLSPKAFSQQELNQYLEGAQTPPPPGAAPATGSPHRVP